MGAALAQDFWILLVARLVQGLAVGALGVAKAFTTGGVRGQTYAETARIFERRLAQVKMRTPGGRARAEEGREYAREFLRRLEEEW